MKRKIPLYLLVLLGMAAGILVGFSALSFEGGQVFVRNWVVPWGKLFVRLLQLVAVPLVFVSLIKGVTGLQDIRKVSALGGKTISLYMITTLFAVLVGVGAGLIVRPGGRIDRSNVAHLEEQYRQASAQNEALAAEASQNAPLDFLYDIVPDNIVSSLSSNSSMLQVIFFAVFFGVAALMLPREKIRPVIEFIDALNEIVLKMVDIIIRCAPVGVAALMAGLVVDFGGKSSVFAALGLYVLTAGGAMLFLLFVFYPLLIRVFGRMGYADFIRRVYPLQLFAFTTSSSAATLPVTMDTVRNKLGVSDRVSSFVLPVGVTINMDGTSCYQAVSVLFIAQALGVDLSIGQLLVIIGMTVLSSIGTPGIPGGSYVVLTMVLTSVGIPAEGLALILGVDRPLDMLRTSVNVTGDAVVARLVDSSTIPAPAVNQNLM